MIARTVFHDKPDPGNVTEETQAKYKQVLTKRQQIQRTQDKKDDTLEWNVAEWDRFYRKLSVRSSKTTLQPKASNTAQKLAQQQAQTKPKKSMEELVPLRYHNYLKVFSKQEANRFPPSQPWDHEIEMKEDFEPRDCRIYPLSPIERSSLDEWINEQLEKGYIRLSKLPQASPFFFVGKKDGKLRPIQDYRRLNKFTKKNAYPIPLISETIDRLKGANYFTKMDVRWGYNNIRIKDGDQWKAAFKT